MKKILLVAALFLSINLRAQEQTILSRPFWQDKPDLASVKAKMQGFNFKDIENGDDPLSLAISADAPLEVIKYLADQPGVNFKRGIHEGRTYLHAAAAKPDAEVTDYLLQKGSDMHFADSHDQTAITYAAFMGRITLPVIQAFEKHGLDLKKKYEKKNDADLLLMSIGADKDFAITNYLVSKGLSIHAIDNKGNNAFDYAVKYGNVLALKKLVGKDVKYSEKDLVIAAQGPFRSANTIDVYKYLVDDLKISPTVTSESGENVLHYIATKNNQDDIITYFFQKGVDINQPDKEGNTPFMGASRSKDHKVVALLLPKAKNINAVNEKGQSALTMAVNDGSSETIKLLLDKGAEINIKDKQGNNLAYYLVQSYRGKGGRGSFGRGAGDPNADFVKKLSLLKSKGLNFTAPQEDGNTLYHLAIEKNDPQLFAKLNGLGIDINTKNKEGYTPLHKAALTAKNDELLKFLVSNGAKKEVFTDFNETAYSLAKENEALTQKQVSVEFLK